DLLLHLHRADPGVEVGLHLVLVAGVGVDHVPVPRSFEGRTGPGLFLNLLGGGSLRRSFRPGFGFGFGWGRLFDRLHARWGVGRFLRLGVGRRWALWGVRLVHRKLRGLSVSYPPVPKMCSTALEKPRSIPNTSVVRKTTATSTTMV